MENRDRPPLGSEVYEALEATLYSVQKRYGAMLKPFAEDLPGASPIARVLGGYEGVSPPKYPIALCKRLGEYAVEVFATEARVYPLSDSLPGWLESLARRVEERIIDHVLSIGSSGSAGRSAFSLGLTYHAGERQMREAIRDALQTRAPEKLQALSKSEESPVSAAFSGPKAPRIAAPGPQLAASPIDEPEQTLRSDGAAGKMPRQNIGDSAQDAQAPTDRQQGEKPSMRNQKTEGIDKALREIAAASAAPAPEPLKTGKRRGRRPNQPRRDAIRNTISKHGEPWRDHLSEIFADLDSQAVALGDFQVMKIDVGEGVGTPVLTWADLDYASGEQRRQIIGALRKYTD
jgi:hypothetical protein